MDTWMRVLVVLAVVPMTFAAGIKYWYLVKRLQNDTIPSNNELHINILFKFIMPETHCIQVATDDTEFALSFQEELHKSDGVPPLVTAGSWSEEEGCKGFVIIANSIGAMTRLLNKMPRWSEHRILVILRHDNVLLGALTIDTSIFRDAEAALVSSSNLTSGFMLTSEQRNYVPFYSRINHTWKRLVDGPRNFNGRSISVLTSNCSMFSQIGPMNRSGEPGWTSGVEMDMFKDIAERLKLRPKFNVTKSIHAGWYKAPLTRDRLSDIAFCGILVSSKTLKSKEITISQPLTLLCLKLLVPRPKPVIGDWEEIFRPFTAEVWLLIAVVSLFITFFLQRFAAASRRLVYTKNIKKYELLGESFLQVFSILALTDVPRSVKEQGSIRHILTWWSIFTLVMTTSFSSGLISHLTNKDYTKKIDTVEELIRNNYYWAMKTRPEFSDLLNLNVSYQVRWKYRFIKVNNSEEHENLIKRGKQVLWGYEVHGGFSLPDTDLPNYILKQFEVSSHCFMEYYIGFAMRRGSPYLLPVNRYISWYTEAGLVSAIIKNIHSKRYIENPYVYSVLRQTKRRPGEAGGLVMSQLSGIFTVWCVGTALSILVFLLEIAQKYRI